MIELSKKNLEYIKVLKDIYEVYQELGTKTYIWAGLVPDIFEGRFLREHSDLDGFTLGLWENRFKISDLYRNKGYKTIIRDDYNFLRIERNGVHAVFNILEIDGNNAKWYHAGKKGIINFPSTWLPNKEIQFYNTKAFVSGIKFEFLLKKHSYLCGPNWAMREKDIQHIKWLEKKIDMDEFELILNHKLIWCKNDYWVERGFDEYKELIYADTNRKIDVNRVE